jgi:hypothetical protein
MPKSHAKGVVMVKAGWTMTALFVLFMMGASVVPKMIGAAPAVESLVSLEWPTQYLLFIGCMELAFVLLYAIPRTSMLGAILMTGLLGGAIASQLRAGSPLFSHTLFGIYLGLFMWTSLWLRDPRCRAFLALR